MINEITIRKVENGFIVTRLIHITEYSGQGVKKSVEEKQNIFEYTEDISYIEELEGVNPYIETGLDEQLAMYYLILHLIQEFDIPNSKHRKIRLFPKFEVDNE